MLVQKIFENGKLKMLIRISNCSKKQIGTQLNGLGLLVGKMNEYWNGYSVITTL